MIPFFFLASAASRGNALSKPFGQQLSLTVWMGLKYLQVVFGRQCSDGESCHAMQYATAFHTDVCFCNRCAFMQQNRLTITSKKKKKKHTFHQSTVGFKLTSTFGQLSHNVLGKAGPGKKNDGLRQVISRHWLWSCPTKNVGAFPLLHSDHIRAGKIEGKLAVTRRSRHWRSSTGLWIRSWRWSSFSLFPLSMKVQNNLKTFYSIFYIV